MDTGEECDNYASVVSIVWPNTMYGGGWAVRAKHEIPEVATCCECCASDERRESGCETTLVFAPEDKVCNVSVSLGKWLAHGIPLGVSFLRMRVSAINSANRGASSKASELSGIMCISRSGGKASKRNMRYASSLWYNRS